MKGTYRLADRVIEIESLHSGVHRMCEDYRWDGAPDIRISVGQAEIDAERARSARAEADAGAVQSHTDGYLETLAVYRAIAERMPAWDTFLFHGSAVAVDGAAYIFAAKSGTGKSTHAALWRRLLGERAVMVNDDKPMIRVGEGGCVVYGTPWDGKHRLSRNIAVSVRAVCLLERASVNHIEAIGADEAYTRLLQQTYRPMDAAAMARTLALLSGMTRQVGLYRLGCNMDLEAAATAYEAMKP